MAILALVGCSLRNVPTLAVPSNIPTTPSVSADSLLGANPKELSATLDQEFTDAQALAKIWRGDAVLYAHTVDFPTNLVRGQSKRVYIFGSAGAPADWWTVTINERTGERIRALIPRADYLGGDLSSVPMEYWKINSIQALLIADAGGGKVFRAANPGAEVTASLMHKGPNGWLWWVVAYRGLDNKTLSVRVHPTSGQIYGEDGKPIETASPTPTSSPAKS